MFSFGTNNVEYVAKQLEKNCKELINLTHDAQYEVRQSAIMELKSKVYLILSALSKSMRLDIILEEVSNCEHLLLHSKQSDDCQSDAIKPLNLPSSIQVLLTESMRKEEDIRVRLAYYSYITSVKNVLEIEKYIARLIEDTAVELRRLYNRTRCVGHCEPRIVDYVCGSGGSTMCPVYDGQDEFIIDSEVPDPDYESIKTLVSANPNALIDHIRDASGELKDKSDIWPSNG